MYTLNFAKSTVQYTWRVETKHCAFAQYAVHCTLCTVRKTLYAVHCTLCTVHCALFIEHYTVQKINQSLGRPLTNLHGNGGKMSINIWFLESHQRCWDLWNVSLIYLILGEICKINDLWKPQLGLIGGL